jgi:hypothetical protein
MPTTAAVAPERLSVPFKPSWTNRLQCCRTRFGGTPDLRQSAESQLKPASHTLISASLATAAISRSYDRRKARRSRRSAQVGPSCFLLAVMLAVCRPKKESLYVHHRPNRQQRHEPAMPFHAEAARSRAYRRPFRNRLEP